MESELSSPGLAIVVPTYNERDNIAELVSRLESTLQGIPWEVIFVDDDSADGTADRVRELAATRPGIRCIQRIGRRGLSSAVIEGMMATSAPLIAVMDADLQHDELLLSAMYERLVSTRLDLVIGSRMVEGGDNQGLKGWRRQASEYSSRVARRVFRLEVQDLMSGFFMLRREVLTDSVRDLSGAGFKILLDILTASPRPLKFEELPYRFRSRNAGNSKLDSNAAVALLLTLIDKTLGRVIPYRLVAFLMVGFLGLFVHFAVLTLLLKVVMLAFVPAQSIATVLAMTSNFAINNLFTYRDIRLRGLAWVRGWISFMLVCGFGAVANVGVAASLFQSEFSWGLSAFAGILVGTAWNYGVTRWYTWQVR